MLGASSMRGSALEAATDKLEVVKALLHNDAGVVGAGSLAMREFG